MKEATKNELVMSYIHPFNENYFHTHRYWMSFPISYNITLIMFDHFFFSSGINDNKTEII